MSNLVIVAIPDENDRVWKVSSDKVPHLTICFLGDADQVQNLDSIVGFTMHAADMMLNRFYLTVDRRDVLGEDQADVLFFKKDRYDYRAVRDFRSALLKDTNIKTAYDNSTQFGGAWQPHLTLGYPASPAKSILDDQFSTIYDVNFNKIAVWTDDFDGPEFLLKDYWDEADTMEVAPMDVAMSDIRHHGVKGMRWGVRKEDVEAAAKSSTSAVGKAVRDIHRFAGDVAFESKTAPGKDSAGDETPSEATRLVASGARKPFKNEDLPALKARHPNAGFKTRLLKPLSAEARAYRKDAKETYIKRLETTANSMKNPSGTREYTIRERGGDLPKSKYIWEVSSREARHAADDSTIELEVVMDSDGYITDLKPVTSESSMAQTIDLGQAFLSHYGVKGMRWGVRNEQGGSNTSGVGETKREGIQKFLDPQGHELSRDIVKTGIGTLVPIVAPLTWPAQIRLIRGAARGGKAKALDRQEKKFAKNAMSPKNFVAIHNGSVEKFNRDVQEINKRYPKPNQNVSTQKKYDGEVLKLLQDSYRESANSLVNKANTMHLDLEFKNDGQDFLIHARQGPGTPMGQALPSSGDRTRIEQVRHAAEDVADEEITVEITGKIKRDANGYIVGLDFDHLDSAAKHSLDLGATLVSSLLQGETLSHYGVKGMRWGVRRAQAVTTHTHIDTGLRRRRTQVQTKGGESQPAHDDAIKAAVAKRVVKKSGTDALSTQELRDLANRLQVENQVSILMSSKGKQFVQKTLEGESKQALRKGAVAAAPRVAKKVKRGAATAATIGALAL